MARTTLKIATIEKRNGRSLGGAIVATVARLCAPVWVVPALMVNVDWSPNADLAWNLAAAGSILASAVFIEAALHAKSWLMRPLLIVLGLFLALCNVQVAFENVSHRSDHRSDHRATIVKTSQNQSSQRSQWSQGRKSAAEVAGETPADTLRSLMQQTIARDARRWTATQECNPALTTARDSMAFCSEVAAIKGKIAAAEKRDELDRKIEELDKVAGAAEVPRSLDPFADNVAEFLSLFGVKMTDENKRALSAQKDITRSIALELVATFGPTAWLLMVSGMVAVARAIPSAVPPVAREVVRKPAATTAATPDQQQAPADVPRPVPLDDAFHRFAAACLDDATGATMPASEPWKLWSKWCEDNKVEPGTQKSFGGKMKKQFAWEPNNNRPRYLNIRAKQAGALAPAPALRIVRTA